MLKNLLAISVSVFVLYGCGSSDSAPKKTDVIDDAYMICGAIKNTGMTTQCTVQGGGRTVDVTIDTNGEEARKICAGVSGQMSKKTSNFNGKWELRVFSPYSGDKPIATCTLY